MSRFLLAPVGVGRVGCVGRVGRVGALGRGVPVLRGRLDSGGPALLVLLLLTSLLWGLNHVRHKKTMPEL